MRHAKNKKELIVNTVDGKNSILIFTNLFN